MAVLLTILTDPRDPTPRRTLALPPNTSILKSAHAASIEITATCGGRGRCTSCRVKFVAGTIPPPTIMDEIQLGNDLVREGYRLSCQCVPSEAVTVQVAPPLEERAFQILGAGPGVVGMGRVTLDSGIRKQVVKVSLPREEHHQISDLEQLAAALGVTPTDVGLAVLQGLPAALRDDPAGVTVTTFAPPGGRGSERVVAVERGDTAGMKFGLAVDIGTTSVVSTLIELDSGEQLASVSSLNPQAVFGGDLMSRIAFAQFDPGNLRKLHTRIIGLLNRHIEETCRQSGVLAKWIYKVVVVGNTCMHHLLLGIDPSFVGLAPYAPVMRHALVLPARELFLKVAPEARVCLLPLVAGFVGADAVAVALATRIYEGAAIRIAVDIGTNGEVILGSRDRLWACSAPAGPALEGAQIRHGMRGALGAIDRVTVDDDLHVHTIGEADGLGICGSGLIDLVAGLLDAGVIDWTGLIQVESRAPHRADPAPSGGADPLRRQRGGARRPALPRLRDRAPARGERGGAHRACLARRPPGLRADLRRGHELPATRMSRVIAAKLVGLEVGAVSQTIDPRWLMAYAAALGETDPRYYDTSAPSGPLAHPLFAVCYEWAVALTVRSKTIKPELMPLGVHTTHHLVIHRRPQAGDRLLTRGQLLTVRPSRSGTLVVIRYSTVDRNGRPVTTTDYGSVFRGVTTDGKASVAVQPLERLEPPAGDEIRWSAAVPVATQAAHVYSECARIWNPIHTDIAAARAAGLPGLILHGTATLALAVSQLVRHDLAGDATRVTALAARLTGMVPMPSTFTVRGRGRAGDLIAFDAVTERGEPVLSDGVLRVL